MRDASDAAAATTTDGGPAGAEPPPHVAVYGGSFDPPHVAHVLTAAWVLATAEVTRLLVIPTFQHPFDKPLAPYGHRVRMCELAMADLRRVEVSRIEEELGGASLTVRTLEALRARLPGARLSLVLGSDLLAETARWTAFDRIRELAELRVVARTGHLRASEGRFAVPELPMPEVSSTEVRRRLGAGEDVGALVPSEVVRYLRAHGLYGARPERR
jgi:nicotinate-nucleotide adenylyltransferase